MSGTTEGKLPDEVPDAPAPRARLVVPHAAGTTPSPEGITYSTEPAIARRRRAAAADPMDTASRAIARLNDDGVALSKVERSNLFDDWREALTRAAESGLARSPYQRQVVGALRSSALRKDVVDFTAEQITAFRTTTNIARANPVAIDVDRALRILTQNSLLRPLALSPDGLSDEHEARLSAILQRFEALGTK